MFGIKPVVNQNYNEGLAVSVRLGMKEVAKERHFTSGSASDGFIYDKENCILIKDENRYQDMGGHRICQTLNNEGILKNLVSLGLLKTNYLEKDKKYRMKFYI